MARLATSALVLVALLASSCGEDPQDEPSRSADAPASASGCDEGVGKLILSATEAVSAGEMIGIEVRNLSEDQVLTYGLGSELERAENGEWVAVELPLTPIPQIALIVRPGETSSGGGGATQDRLELPENLEPGSYRVVKQVTAGEPAGGGSTDSLRLCASFTVAP